MAPGGAGYGTPGQVSVHPLDAELCLPGRSYSYEVCRRLVGLAVLGPFDEAVGLLAEATGVKIAKNSKQIDGNNRAIVG